MSTFVVCIGAGRMGRGIAQCAAYSGHKVILVDAKPRGDEDFERLRDVALAEVASALGTLAALNAFDASAIATIMQRIEIRPLVEAASALAQADIVFEAVPEVEALKAQAFKLFDQHAPPDALLASTTSTFLSTMLAKHTARPSNFLNAHWLNPAFLMPLVELSPADETAPDAVAQMRAFLTSMGKVPIVCKASPGYIVPRIQALAMNEAARIVEEGVASAEDVDKAIAYGFGPRFAVLGLLEFIDWGGGDILYYASEYMAEAMDDERFRAPDVVVENMKSNQIGISTGKGFFDYANVDVEAYRKQKFAEFFRMFEHLGQLKPPVV